MHKLIAVLLPAFAALAAAAVPCPGYYYPSSVQAGTTTRVIVGGVYMGGVRSAWVSGEGVKITKVVIAPGFPRAAGRTQIPWVMDWLYDIVNGKCEHQDLPPEAVSSDTDWQDCNWWANLDEHDNPEEMQIIARFLYTPENYPQPTPALDQLLVLDVEVAPDAKPGRRTIMLYDGSTMSAPHPFYVTREPHVKEEFFVIPPIEDKGMAVPAVLHYPTNLPVQTLPVVLDGQVWPGETDEFKLRLTKGRRITCELNARELLPYLGDAVPGWFNPVMRLIGPNGREVAYADDFFYLPDPILSCVVPEDGVYKLVIFDNLYRGRSDFVYFVRCYEDAADGPSYKPQQRAFECFPPAAAHFPPKAGKDVDLRTGTIDFPGRVIRHDFKVSEPKTLNFELFARRQGSPVDGLIQLYGPLKGSTSLSVAPLLAKWDDVEKFLCGSVPQACCDARGSWKFLEPGDYCVTVSDRAGEGGPDYVYTLAITPFEPEFEVYTERSSFICTGNAISFSAKIVRRNGFDGVIKFDDNDDFICDTFCNPGADTADITLNPKGDWKGMKCVNFTASAEIAPGKVKTVGVTPGDSVEQAFAYTHLLPAHSFYFFNPAE